MPAFSYQIISKSGKRTSGRLDASCTAEAAARLRGGGAHILALQPATPITSASAPTGNTDLPLLPINWAMRLRPPRTAERAHLLAHLSMMLRAGIPIGRALRLCHQEIANPWLRQATLHILTAVENGVPLSTALDAHPRLFTPVTRGILAASEESGNLADGLDRATRQIEHWHEIRQRLLQSLAYPATIFLLAIVVTIILATVFIPRVRAHLAAADRSLPPIAEKIFQASAFLQVHGLTTGICLLSCLSFASILLWKSTRARRTAESLLLRLPLIGDAWRSAMLARLFGLLAVLLHSGTPLVKAIATARGALAASPRFTAYLERVGQAVLHGRALRDACADPLVPPSCLGVISAGEQSGQLVPAFHELESHLEKRLTRRVAAVTAVIEPTMILFVGGIVGVVYLALFSSVVSISR